MWTMLTGVALAPLVLLVEPIKQHRDLPSVPTSDESRDGCFRGRDLPAVELPCSR